MYFVLYTDICVYMMYVYIAAPARSTAAPSHVRLRPRTRSLTLNLNSHLENTYPYLENPYPYPGNPYPYLPAAQFRASTREYPFEYVVSSHRAPRRVAL